MTEKLFLTSLIIETSTMRLIVILVLVSLFLPYSASAQILYDYDVAATVGSITFIPAEIRASEETRIYGTIVNVGKKDISGYIGFYQGVLLLGKPQPFSLKAGGVPEEFWIDWSPQEGTYNIMMTVIDTEPRDQNSGNNVALTRMLTITKRPPPVPLAPAAPLQALQAPQAVPPVQIAPLPAQAPVGKIIPLPLANPKVELSKKENEQASKVALKHFLLPPIGKGPKDRSGTTTPVHASSTPMTAPQLQALSSELTKSVGLYQTDVYATSTPSVDVRAENPEPPLRTVKSSSSSSSTVMVYGIIAVILFLIGLLLLKKSKA